MRTPVEQPVGQAEQPEGLPFEMRMVRHVIDQIVMSPQHTKAFSAVLQSNIERYEQMFGEIPAVEVPGSAPEGGQGA